MKKLLIICGGLVLLAGCKDETKEAANLQNNQSAKPDSSGVIITGGNDGDHCFASFRNKDTVTLRFTQTDTLISGELVYQFYEKDKNRGSILGVIKGDTIVADYTFNSEGTSSRRQVVFLRRNGELVEGFGDVEPKDGKMIFRDLSTLTFDNSMVLQATDCSKIPGQH